ncbi:MAG: bifunctional riboflavin kinase/FAD synthetase [Pseudomonadota bacterium]
MSAGAGERLFAAIGNFDGVHRGHRALLDATATAARSADAALGAAVFEPHPRRFFQPDAPAFLLTTAEERARLLNDAGASRVLTIPFDAPLAAMTPRAFVFDILRERLGLAGVAAGADFRFGKDRAGDAQALARLAAEAGLQALIVDPVAAAGAADDKIGSSAVRAALRDGAPDRACALLGRSWTVSGVVQEGRRLGRTLGFPTANLALGDLVEPKYGVYAVTADCDGTRCAGVANFGRRPTLGDTAPLLETHLFDFDGDLYGRALTVALEHFIRPEMKFDGVEALKNRIAEDVAAARALMA